MRNSHIRSLQGKSQPYRPPFLAALGDIHRDGHIVAGRLGLRDGEALYQWLCRLQGTQSDGIIEDFPLESTFLLDECSELTILTERSDFPIAQMDHGVHHIIIVGRYLRRHLFKLGEVIAEEIALTEGGQTCCQSNRAQSRLV